MRIDDPRAVKFPWYTDRVAPLLNERRDAVFVGLMAQCGFIALVGVVVFYGLAGPYTWAIAPVYWLALVGGFMDRFTLMLHCTSHRQLFNPRFRSGNNLIPWVLGPFFGQTPTSYFAHHMGMHHREENLADDLSSTMEYERNRFSHWLRYYFRFLFVGLFDLSRYFASRGRGRLLRSVLVGEISYGLVVLALLFVNPAATFVVFLAPLLIIRTLMMMGNWGQHAFISQEHPEDAYLSSITCINSRYNRRCFNDGYHIGHHLAARAHWTEYPVEFEKNLETYGRKDAIVFEGIDFFMVWLYLVTGSWKRLARAFVQLPGAPQRDEDAIVALLKERVRAFAPAEQAVPATDFA